jgi:hypothetical protein
MRIEIRRRLAMAKQLSLVFGALGYALVIWFYIVSPYEHSMKVLSFVCPTCPIVETVGHTWALYLLIFGPVNAAMYAAGGFLVGRASRFIKNRRLRTHNT